MNVVTRKGKRKLGTKVLVYILALLMLFTQFANVTFAIEDNVNDVNDMQNIELPLENDSGSDGISDNPEVSGSPQPSATAENTTETPAPTESLNPSETDAVVETPDPIGIGAEGTPIATDDFSPTAVPTQEVLLNGTGLTALYYKNSDFTDFYITKLEPQVNMFNLLNQPSRDILDGSFSMKWIGSIQPGTTDSYTFYTNADNCVRLYIDGKIVISDWLSHTNDENSGTIALEAGKKYEIVLEYYNNSYLANISLSWSNSTNSKEIIPQKNLYPVDQNGLARELVMQAENEMSPKGLEKANAYVEQLPDGEEKISLSKRLDDVLFSIYIIAANLVDEAKADMCQEDLDRALDYVKQLPDDTTKSMLLKKLAEIEIKIKNQFTGNGLTAEYYDGTDFSTLKAVKIIESVDGDLTLEEPVSTDNFGLRLSGRIKPKYTGTYTFYVSTDNESKLWIDEQLVYSGEGGGKGNIDLTAGESYELKMECTGDEYSSVFLEWSGAGQTREIVPKKNLYSQDLDQFAQMKVIDAELQKTQISVDNARIAVAAIPEGTLKNELLSRIAVAQAAVDTQSNGTGLLGMYYDNLDFSSLKAVQIDPTINYDWDINDPLPVVNGEEFSICWKGQIQPLYSGEYTFYTQTDDGIRVYIDNQLVIDNWTLHPKTEDSGKITLEANKKYDIKIEFFENYGQALVSLEWKSSNQVREVVPKKCLYPADYEALVDKSIVKSEADKTIASLKAAEEMIQFVADSDLKASYTERTTAVRASILKPIGYIDGLKNDALLAGIYKVRGWILDGVGVSKIEIVVDDTVLGEATYGSTRPDVRNYYPDYENSNSGFYYDLNVDSLPKGNHTLKVVETGKNGIKTTLKEIRFITKLPAIGAIESPTGSSAIEGKFNVRGWFLDPSGVSKIEVYVNDVLDGEADYGILRYDVYNAYSSYKNYNAGFSYTLDTKSLKSRINTLKVIGYANDGTVKVLPLRQFELKLSVKGWIDTPTELAAISGSTVVSGWVLDKRGVSKVEILIDGQVAGTAVYGLSRPDVINVYPEYNNPNSGFKYTLNTQDISEGKHIISVLETDEYGISTLVCKKVVFVSSVAAIGFMDTPVNMASVSGKIKISGWVLDKNGVSNVYVYVDGVFNGEAAYGGLRKDVKIAYPSYDNENCGMSYILNTTKLAAGQHIIKIVELSNNGAINIISSRTIVKE